MKYFTLLVFCAAQIFVTTSKIIPDYLPQLCSKSAPNYSDCTLKVFKQFGPYLLKGIKEINFPRTNPLDIPLFAVNRTLSDTISINAALKNIRFWGYDAAEIEDFKFDTQNLNGELHLRIPFLRASIEYDVIGRLFTIDLHDAGTFKGNFTNLGLVFKFALKPVDKLGVKYYAYSDFKAKGTIDDGHFKLIAKNAEDQAAADAIANFVNPNFQRSLDAILPIYDEALSVFYRSITEQVLSSIPAEELIPE